MVRIASLEENKGMLAMRDYISNDRALLEVVPET
jgi:hypothetical protein